MIVSILLLVLVLFVKAVAAPPAALSTVINLRTKQTRCECGGKLTDKKRSTKINIYTRYGTQEGLHHEYR